MKRVLLIALPLLLWFPHSVFGQENPKVEVFGGYSYFRASQFDFAATNLHGFDASVAANLNSWFGVEGDFGGHFGAPSFGPFRVPYLDVNLFTFMGGPKVAYRGSSALTPFAHFLIGTTRANASAFGLGYGKNALSTVVGGGLDIRLSEHVAVRAVQADYLMTRFFDERQNNMRLSGGVVFRF
jgi:hypothetical protein